MFCKRDESGLLSGSRLRSLFCAAPDCVHHLSTSLLKISELSLLNLDSRVLNDVDTRFGFYHFNHEFGFLDSEYFFICRIGQDSLQLWMYTVRVCEDCKMVAEPEA